MSSQRNTHGVTENSRFGNGGGQFGAGSGMLLFRGMTRQDRKSTRLNSSHLGISYAVFCLKKKNVSRYHRPCVYLAGACQPAQLKTAFRLNSPLANYLYKQRTPAVDRMY